MAIGKSTHIIVIGGGIIGASLAYELSRRIDTKVTILESEYPCSGASGHSFAWVNAFGKGPRHYHTLNRRSLDMWYRFSDKLNADIGIHYGGELRWENDRDGAIALIDKVHQLQSWGYPCRLISKDELLTLEPDICPGEVLAASHSEADIHIETDQFISICLDRAVENGATIHTKTEVHGVNLRNGKIDSVRTKDSILACDILVLSAGVNTSKLASLVEVDIPQQYSPGIVIKTTKCQKLLSNVAVLHAPPRNEAYQHLHLRQLNDGTLRIGQGTQEGINKDASKEHADCLLSYAKSYFPKIGDTKAIPIPVGYRPMPIDGFPVIGFTKSVPNMYITLMHSGVTLAPIVSEMATIEIVAGVKVDWFSPYRPDRFSR